MQIVANVGKLVLQEIALRDIIARRLGALLSFRHFKKARRSMTALTIPRIFHHVIVKIRDSMLRSNSSWNGLPAHVDRVRTTPMMSFRFNANVTILAIHRLDAKIGAIV